MADALLVVGTYCRAKGLSAASEEREGAAHRWTGGALAKGGRRRHAGDGDEGRPHSIPQRPAHADSPSKRHPNRRRRSSTSRR
jgi:hypothetical protein